MLRETDPEKQIALYEVLEKESPDSKYIQQLNPLALSLYAKMKPDKSYAFAQRAIAKDPNNEDLLLVLAGGALDRKQYDAAATFGTRAAKASKGSAKSGRGYYIAGMAYQAQNKHPQAIENLKACLPLLKGEPPLVAQAEFYIGLANYQLAAITHEKPTMQEALKYSEMAAASGTPIAKNAAQNAYAIKQELARMR
jgi:tetratricopeptide (TPR) repeat protein